MFTILDYKFRHYLRLHKDIVSYNPLILANKNHYRQQSVVSLSNE